MLYDRTLHLKCRLCHMTAYCICSAKFRNYNLFLSIAGNVSYLILWAPKEKALSFLPEIKMEKFKEKEHFQMED